jgi:hypothetical protein
MEGHATHEAIFIQQIAVTLKLSKTIHLVKNIALLSKRWHATHETIVIQPIAVT